MDELQTPAAGSTEAAPATTVDTAQRRAKLSEIVPSLTNRKNFDPVALQELAENIKAMGVIEPIVLRRLPPARLAETWNDRKKGEPAPVWEIVAGERRYRASKMAGLDSIPFTERVLTDAQALHVQLVENVQREDLHPLDEARAYRAILDLPDEADKPMAERIGTLAKEVKKSTRHIYQTLQLLKLCDFAQKVFQEKDAAGRLKLPRTIAVEIATIGAEAQQIEATRHCAGLAKTSTEVVSHPLSHRAAAEYIRNNYRLLLSKAPFPVKVEFAGVGPCTSCDKMSANARELFDEGAKVLDTCMDRSCYGKKNAAHFEQIAAVAKKSGQRVITGKEAQKLLPYENPEPDPDEPEDSDTGSDYIAGGDYENVDEKQWQGKCNGRTLRQLLGKDMPKPIMIQRPSGRGFVEVLPKADVKKLLHEKGLLSAAVASSSSRNPYLEDERKAKRVKEQRWAIATAILEAVGKVPVAPAVQLEGQSALLSSLLLELGVQTLYRLHNDDLQRVRKLLGWENKDLGYNRGPITKLLRSLDAAQFNQAMVAALIAGDLGVNTHNHGMAPRTLDSIAALVNVDAAKIRADMQAEEKAKQAAKKKPAAKADTTAAKQPAVKATKARAIPAGEKIGGTPQAATPADIDGARTYAYVWRRTTADDAKQLLVTQEVRVIDSDEGLSPEDSEYAGRFGKVTAAADDKGYFTVFLLQVGGKPAVATNFHYTDLMVIKDRLVAVAPGYVVHFRHNLKADTGAKFYRKCAGRRGVVSSVKGKVIMVKCDGFKELYRAELGDLELIDGEAATAAAPAPTDAAAKKTAKASKPAAKKANEGKQLALGDLEQPKTISPQQAWPFPTVTGAKAFKDAGKDAR